MSKQPEALRIAEYLSANQVYNPNDVADELRRQHALIEELREALKGAEKSLGVICMNMDLPTAQGVLEKCRAALAKAEAQQ
jgi:hypothetical protein